jgi:hypothetical protein
VRLASPGLIGQGNGRRQPPASKRKTAEFRRWTTVNLTDARTDIEDTELFWLENGISIGKGVIQILNGPGAPVATLAQGVSTLWGFVLNGSPVMIAVGPDGSLTQVTPGGVTTVIAGAGIVTPLAHLTMWQGTTILILDPTLGYFSWNGTTFTVIDATRVGESIAVFEGRAWLAHNRTITFTAPGTFNDFTIGNGAGTVIITDEAFIGNITHMISLVEQLWIFGPASVETISNVGATGVAPTVVTSFALTNVSGALGSSASNSGVAYFRAVAFMSPGGIYAISGVTPQQLSEKIDQMFPGLTLTPDVPGAVGLIQNLYCLLYLVNYTQATVPQLPTPANGLTTATPLLIGFTKGKTFFASQGATLRWITTLIVNGVSQAWGSDASGNIFQLFGAANDQPVAYKVVGKLHPLGKAVAMKALMKIGVELQATHLVAPTLTIDSDLGSKAIALAPAVALRLLNQQNQILLLQNSSGQTLTLLGQGLALPKQDAAMFGHYLGWTITGNDPPYRLQAIQMEFVETRDWNA